MSVGTLADLVFHVRNVSSGRPELLSVLLDGRREVLSAADFLRNVHSLALALEGRGLAKGERVAIFSENRPEWHIVDFACQLIGAPTVPLYPALGRGQAGFMLRNSGCRWVFYSGADKREMLTGLVPTLTASPMLVAFDGAAAADGGTSITRLMGEGAARIGEVPIERFRGRVEEEDLASLIYTSGATGDPKGVMLSHRNLISNVLACGEIFTLTADDLAISMLPLSHGFQRTVDHLCFYRGVAIHYVPSSADLTAALRRERPTVLAAMPAVYERAVQEARELAGARGSLGRRVFRWAIEAGIRRAAAERGGFVGPFLALQRQLADVLVLRGIRRRFGGRLRFPISGSAPISSEVSDFFDAIGTPLFQGYGLTETSPVLASSAPRQHRPGSVGKALSTVELKVAEDGEILAKGPGVMKGYWANPRATAESVDDSGWLHTGDVGRIDQSGYVFITDRKQDLLLTAAGERIAPQPIEKRLTGHGVLAQAVVVGDGRPYLAALLVPDFERLRAETAELAELSDAEIAEHADVLERVRQAVDEVNADLPEAERVFRWRLLERPLSVERGELTHTSKLRRRVVMQRFADHVAALY
jgi:long-chain acyl-CoA synthetase